MYKLIKSCNGPSICEIFIDRLLMPYQSATTGLFSCTAEAYVRDSVYCAAALWSLGLAYRR